MKPLDLTVAPPRSPRAELGGITFLPRSIDKVRASLPGGQLGEYTIPGFTQVMFDTFGLSLDSFTAIVAQASSDTDVWNQVRAQITPEMIEKWHAFVLPRQPRGGNREEALQAYPWLKSRPDLILALDVLEEDDRQHFLKS
jgi:hypothetical protein